MNSSKLAAPRTSETCLSLQNVSISYGSFEAVYAIETLDVLRGKLPRRAHIMVVEWALAHRLELKDNWEKAQRQLPLKQIEPLD